MTTTRTAAEELAELIQEAADLAFPPGESGIEISANSDGTYSIGIGITLNVPNSEHPQFPISVELRKQAAVLNSAADQVAAVWAE